MDEHNSQMLSTENYYEKQHESQPKKKQGRTTPLEISIGQSVPYAEREKTVLKM